MISRPAAPLAPNEATRRVSVAADPAWVSSPGAPKRAAARGRQVDEAGIAFDAVAADPVQTVRGDSARALEDAWQRARRAWASAGEPARPEIPIAVGWLSYDLGRRWMGLATRAGQGDGFPDLEFRFFDAVWLRAVGAPEARIVAVDDAAAARLATKLAMPPSATPDRPAPPANPPAVSALVADQPRAHHAEALARIREYLRAGDAYQVNFARRLTAAIGPGDPVWIAAALRARAPAPHAVWIGSRSRAGGPVDRIIVGNSPERFLSVDETGVVETRPIKGTRPRARDPVSDAAARDELAVAAKDRAEHVMIVDLERNDLGRVCETGSVVASDLMRLVALPTVFHLVSTVRGRLRAGLGLADLLAATFPGGSVTGAPKRRAMEIIDELEPMRRGIYTGATGWLGAAGDLDLAIAIRTATIDDGRLSLFVGGGIVADSDAAAEWEETEDKARAFRDLCATRS